MDRFRTFYEVAKGNGRKLVISLKKAYLLDKLVDDKHLDLPDPWKMTRSSFILRGRNLDVFWRRITFAGNGSLWTKW
jgi:mRNA degradation ribonuclease J1/J2